VIRESHHPGKQSSALLAVKARLFFSSLRGVGLQAIVGREVLAAISRPEHGLTVGRIGLGGVVAKPFARPGIRQHNLRRRCQLVRDCAISARSKIPTVSGTPDFAREPVGRVKNRRARAG
jgi:hypothetical protein